MRLRGGYNVLLTGRPTGDIQPLPPPEVLYVPLDSERFRFSELCVAAGDRVARGQPLARDPGNHHLPLPAPRAGTVDLESAPGHVTLTALGGPDDEPYRGTSAADGDRRRRLIDLGAWAFFHDAFTGALPDPSASPAAVIVSTLQLSSYQARGDVQMRERLPAFLRGLQQLQSLLEYQPIHLVLPDIHSGFARQVRHALRGQAFLTLEEVPLRYPLDHFAVLARGLGLKASAGTVWGLRVEGVLAVDRALSEDAPATDRVISLAGPAAISPAHVQAMPGYPIELLSRSRLAAGGVRIVDGGMLSGRALGPDRRGLDIECTGLTMLPEQTDREFLGFMRPGARRRSYSRCFLSLLRPAAPERRTTGVRGEGRPCIGCGYCEEVCPVGIMPHWIHKLLYQDELEEADAVGMGRCIACGLCSFVCPSKLELREEFVDARGRLAAELAEAQRAEAQRVAAQRAEAEQAEGQA